MQSDGNNVPKPRRRPRRRQNQNNHHDQDSREVFSDSNIPNATTPNPEKTPESKKTPGKARNFDRAVSATAGSNKHATHNQQPKPRPVSIAAANGSLATPAKASYAGAAFNASPAPSSLPVPKFFSKSVPQATAANSLSARIERDGDKSDSNDGNLVPSLSPAISRSQVKSPLDMFFDADRQEKARTGSAGAQGHSVPLSRNETPSKPKDMFMLELDGASSPASSQHATPSSTRPQPPSTQRARTAPGNVPTLQEAEEDRRAQQTQSLKNFLNITAAQSPADAQSFSTPRSNPIVTPQQTPQQDPNLHYGNRNLSPLFHASRFAAQSSPALSQGFASVSPQPGHYGNVYGNGNAYSPAPSQPSPASATYHPRPPPPRSYDQSPMQPSQPIPVGHQQQQQQQQHIGQQAPSAAQGSQNDVKAMEDKMRKMLNMG